MVALPDSVKIEWILFGDIYGYLLAEDRRPEGVMPRDCDPLTGLPLNLAPKVLTQREFNPATQKIEERTYVTPGSLILPPSLAKGGVALAGEMTLWAGSDDPAGGPGTPGLAADHLVRIENGKKRRLSSIPRSQWTSEEVNTWREYAYRIRKVFAYWATLGLVNPRPIIFENPEPYGVDGLPRVVRPTWKLLELVRQKVPGTPYANRPKSILHDLTPEERLSQPDYAQKSFQAEAGGSAEAPLKEEHPVAKIQETKGENECLSSSSSSATSTSECPASSKTTPKTQPNSESGSSNASSGTSGS